MDTLSVRQAALADVQNALPVFEQINNLYLQAENLNQQVMLRQANAANVSSVVGRAKSGAIAFGSLFITLPLCAWVSNFMANSHSIGLAAILICLVAPFAIAYYLYKGIKDRDMNVRVQKAENNAITEFEPQMEQLSQEIYRLYTENAALINPIPRDYRNYNAVVFFESALANGRADSMKEALNLYEEYLHRAALELNSQMALEQSRQQSAMLANIEESSRQTAVNSGIAAGFSVLNFLSNI